MRVKLGSRSQKTLGDKRLFIMRKIVVGKRSRAKARREKK